MRQSRTRDSTHLPTYTTYRDSRPMSAIHPYYTQLLSIILSHHLVSPIYHSDLLLVGYSRASFPAISGQRDSGYDTNRISPLLSCSSLVGIIDYLAADANCSILDLKQKLLL